MFGLLISLTLVAGFIALIVVTWPAVPVILFIMMLVGLKK